MRSSFAPSVMKAAVRNTKKGQSKDVESQGASQVIVKQGKKRGKVAESPQSSDGEGSRKSARQASQFARTKSSFVRLDEVDEEEEEDKDEEESWEQDLFTNSPTQIDTPRTPAIARTASTADTSDSEDSRNKNGSASKYPTYTFNDGKAASQIIVLDEDEDNEGEEEDDPEGREDDEGGEDEGQEDLNRSGFSELEGYAGLDDWVMPVKWDPEDGNGNHFPLEPLGMYETLIVEGGKRSTKVTLETSYVKNVFGMVAVYLYENMSTSGGRHREVDQQLLLYKNLEEMMRTFPTREYPQEAYFNHLPETGWPRCFVEYVNSMKRDTEKALRWAERQKKLTAFSKADKVKAFVGHKIKEVAKAVKGGVSLHVNAKWLEWYKRIPSGYNEEGLFKAIRRSLLHAEAKKKGSNNHKAALSRSSASVQQTISLEEYQQAALKKISFDWYPEYWLAFVVFGLPAGDHCLTCMNNDAAYRVEIDPLGPLSQAVTGFQRSVQSPLSAIAKKGAAARAANPSNMSRSQARNASKADKHGETASNTTTQTGKAAGVDAVQHKIVVVAGDNELLEKRINMQEKIVKMRGQKGVEDMDEEEKKLYEMMRAFVNK